MITYDIYIQNVLYALIDFLACVQKQIFYIPMCFARRIIKLVKNIDFFQSVQLLRMEEQSQYSTTTGGLISLAIIVVISVGFANMVINTFNLSTISYTMKIDMEADPVESIVVADPQKNFMFGIEITNKFYQKFNLSSDMKYFDLSAIYTQLSEGIVEKFQQIHLETCSIQHWRETAQIQDKYEKFGVSNWLCPRIGQNITLEGKYTSKKGALLSIIASPCKNLTGKKQTCASPAQIESFFIENFQTLFLRVFYKNAIINPGQSKYISYYLEDMAYLKFSRKMGVQSYLEISDFVVQTDSSIWPFSTISTDKGHLTNGMIKSFPYFRFDDQDQYFSFNLVKGGTSYRYEREVQKISTVFSFIGGLIGAIVAALFVVNSFTSYSYQISLAREIFEKSPLPQPEEKLNQPNTDLVEDHIKLKKPNLFQFIKVSIYSFLKLIKCNFFWEDMENINQYRQEILKQIDIKLIIKRLIFLQFCLQHIFQSYQLSVLKKIQPFTPQGLKVLRQKVNSKNSEELINEESELKIIEKNCQIKYVNSGDNIQPNISKFDSTDIRYKKFTKVLPWIEEKVCSADTQLKNNQIQPSQISVNSFQTKRDLAIQSNMNKILQSSKKGNRISGRILQSVAGRKQKKTKMAQEINNLYNDSRLKQNLPLPMK